MTKASDTPADKPVGKPADKPVATPAPREVWLTARTSEAFGPKGRFVPLTAAEAATADEGVLTRPTPEQLAQR